MLHDPKRRQRQRRSASAAPDFSVQEESLFQVVDHLPPLFVRFANAHATAPLDIDWQGLMRLAASGGLVVVTARYHDTVVGICISVLTRPLMYRSTLYGTTIAIWLEPPYRAGLNGYRLARASKQALERRGCQRLFIAANQERLARLFERLGYCYSEHSYVSETHAGLSL